MLAAIAPPKCSTVPYGAGEPSWAGARGGSTIPETRAAAMCQVGSSTKSRHTGLITTCARALSDPQCGTEEGGNKGKEWKKRTEVGFSPPLSLALPRLLGGSVFGWVT
ncbi:hypothetical protein SRHO_G00140280 [Serrasalmus rhombeus]